ncbi:hypothetical protein DdX_20920 [Ditylenchus destructor]|uniref:Uncharacterized protein n=1 Tax=Ditylenchus destructor TaxID=166010 RepID=A0AAD4MFS8_9BILA|nr:hypothetical protein DdX_20920 [Ditylenchus destructor]
MNTLTLGLVSFALLALGFAAPQFLGSSLASESLVELTNSVFESTDFFPASVQFDSVSKLAGRYLRRYHRQFDSRRTNPFRFAKCHRCRRSQRRKSLFGRQRNNGRCGWSERFRGSGCRERNSFDRRCQLDNPSF